MMDGYFYNEILNIKSMKEDNWKWIVLNLIDRKHYLWGEGYEEKSAEYSNVSYDMFSCCNEYCICQDTN